MILALDIETYGAVKRDSEGRPLPTQKETKSNGRFNAAKSLFFDRPSELVVSVALTEVLDERGELATADTPISSWVPGRSFYIRPYYQTPDLIRALDACHTIVGHSLMYDISYLMELPVLRPHLQHQLLIDTVILNYLHNERRPERSLKDLGPLFGLFRYDTTLKDQRFRDPGDPLLRWYNCEDTHNTVRLAAHLASLIERDYTPTNKLSDDCLHFYSENLRTCIHVQQSGCAIDTPRLYAMDKDLRNAEYAAHLTCLHHGLTLSGPGSQKSQAEFIDRLICATLPDNPDDPHPILDHPALQRTEKRGDVSWSLNNFRVFREALTDHPDLLHAVRAADDGVRAAKARANPVYPMLRWKSADTKRVGTDKPIDQTSTLIPQTGTKQWNTLSRWSSSRPTSSMEWERSLSEPEIRIAHPNVYPVPSTIKDGEGDSGGQEQVRLSMKQPAVSTFPPSIKALMTPRRRYLLGYDLSQIELRVAALRSGERSMIEAYQKGWDLHSLNLFDIFSIDRLTEMCGLPSPPSTDVHSRDGQLAWRAHPTFESLRRLVSKPANFADLYWSSAETMQSTVYEDTGEVIDLAVFDRAVRTRPTRRPTLYKWQKRLLSTAYEQGYLEVPKIGASRIIPPNTRPNTVINCGIQPVAAAVMIEIVNHLRTLLPPTASIVAIIYDAVYIDTDTIITDLVQQSVAHAADHGVWSALKEESGHDVPLIMDEPEVTPHSSPASPTTQSGLEGSHA